MIAVGGATEVRAGLQGGWPGCSVLAACLSSSGSSHSRVNMWQAGMSAWGVAAIGMLVGVHRALSTCRTFRPPNAAEPVRQARCQRPGAQAPPRVCQGGDAHRRRAGARLRLWGERHLQVPGRGRTHCFVKPAGSDLWAHHRLQAPPTAAFSSARSCRPPPPWLWRSSRTVNELPSQSALRRLQRAMTRTIG